MGSRLWVEIVCLRLQNGDGILCQLWSLACCACMCSSSVGDKWHWSWQHLSHSVDRRAILSMSKLVLPSGIQNYGFGLPGLFFSWCFCTWQRSYSMTNLNCITIMTIFAKTESRSENSGLVSPSDMVACFVHVTCVELLRLEETLPLHGNLLRWTVVASMQYCSFRRINPWKHEPWFKLWSEPFGREGEVPLFWGFQVCSHLIVDLQCLYIAGFGVNHSWSDWLRNVLAILMIWGI